jgi:hypothetical protein
MRLIPARAEAGIDAPVFVVSGVAGALLAPGHHSARPLFVGAICAALFGALSLWQLRRLPHAPMRDGARGEVVKPARSLLLSVPLGALAVAVASSAADPDFGGLIAGAGVARLVTGVGLWRFEKRNGYDVLRRTRRLGPQYLLARQDTAPAQRNPAHAQSEAP